MCYSVLYKLLKNKTSQLTKVTDARHWRRVGEDFKVDSVKTMQGGS